MYSGAPYNFVPMAKKVIKNEHTPAHNNIDEKLNSGVIEFTITAKTPLFIGGGQDGKHFYRTPNGELAIPGSSLKGLVRSNMQILSLGSYANDVEDNNLMYRNVGGTGKVAKYYKESILDVKPARVGGGFSVSIPKNVKSGYMECKNGEYYIYDSVQKPISDNYGLLNYFCISEKKIKDDPSRFLLDSKRFQNRDFEINPNPKQGKWKGVANNLYYPYYMEVYYKASDRTVTSVIEVNKAQGDMNGYQKGYLVSTGYMTNKKVIYVVAEIDRNSAVKVKTEDILAYKRDYEGKKTQLHGTRLKDESLKEAARKFFMLPEEGENRPIFFADYNGRRYFGVTPYIRVFYEKTILEGMSVEQRKSDTIDYAKSLLGYSMDDGAYKSRVRFEDSLMTVSNGTKNYSVVLGGPKPSSYLDYLVQKDSQGTSYNDNFELRGAKQYWLREEPVTKKSSNDGQNNSFEAVEKGSSFNSKLHFTNLNDKELGLLLWSLKLGDRYDWNLGKARNYGFGRVEISNPKVNVYDYTSMYGEALSLNVFANELKSAKEFIEIYKKDLLEKYNESSATKVSSADEIESIKSLQLMKDSAKLPNTEAIRYMDITQKEYQNREYALPTIEETLSGKTGKYVRSPREKDRNNNNYNNGSNSGNRNSNHYNQAKTVSVVSSGKKMIASFEKYDRRTKEVTFEIDGRSYCAKVDAMKVLKYQNMKPGIGINVEKISKDKYTLAD